MTRALRGLWLELRVIPVLLWSFSALTLGTALAARGRTLHAAYYAYAVSMLMVHHYLDREADLQATPRKVTSIVWLGLRRGRWYAIGWCGLALAAALAATARQPRLAPLAVAYAFGLMAHLRCRPDD